MDPEPPATLNKETIRVWHGWMNIGDREVAREAAAKGLHIELAIGFLALRKKINSEDAKLWFKEEVINWVHELLERKQIFKASHVLKNVNVDEMFVFLKIFQETTNRDLREYIGYHLLKLSKLDEEKQDLWHFLNLYLENADSISSYKLPKESLLCLENFTVTCKSEIATALFFKTEDIHLYKFLTPEVLWKYLLINNDVNNILTWINVRYRNNIDDIEEGNLIEIFKKFHITSQMLEMISSEELNVDVIWKNQIYNELSRFGIFQSNERDNFISILRRLKNSFSISKVYEILANNQSALDIKDFFIILTNFCLQGQHLNVLNTCLKDFNIPLLTEQTNLINDFRSILPDFEETVLGKNIFNVSSALSVEIVNYFNDNILIFLSLLFFTTKEIDIVKAILAGETIIINHVILNTCLVNMMEQLPVLNKISLNERSGNLECRVNVYDLIDNSDIKSKSVFQFRSMCKDLFQFYSKDILRICGYSKCLDFKFYIREARPSVAAKFATVEQSAEHLSAENAKKICTVAMTNFDSDEICSSCACYAEMIGFDSTKLRVLSRAAKVICKTGYDRDGLLEVLLSSEDEPYIVQRLLETTLTEANELNLLLSSRNLMNIFRVYEVVIQYSKFSNIKLPELFLRSCASQNLWLSFLLFAQIYRYPQDQIKLLIQFFKSPNMLEHLTHGVVNEIEVEEKNILIRERDSRKYLLSKIGARKSVDTVPQYTTQSVKSQSSFESEESSTGSDFFEIDISNIKATLLQTLIRCHNSTDPPKALLQACQLYRNPLLAIVATSYEPGSLITNWLTYISVSCELCKVFTNYETTAISANLVTGLLENCMKHQHPRSILESLEIFVPENPLKTFMEFLVMCMSHNFNYTALTEKLITFQEQLKSFRKNSIINETDHDMTYLTNKLWIEMSAIRLLSALLEYNCSSQFEQIIMIDHLSKLSIWKYFSCECLNVISLLNILRALYNSGSGVRLNISVTFDLRNNRQAIISCINELLEKQQYKVALKIAQLENLPPDLILVKKWQNKMNFRKDQKFWNVCNKIFEKYSVTADCVIDFYLDCSEKIHDLVEKFLLLKLATQWAAKYDLTCQYELEKKMWLAFVLLDEKYKNLDIFDIKGSTYLYKNLDEALKNINPYEGELSKDFASQLERIIAYALNKNNFWVALKLQKMFNCKSTDLETLKLCHSLAEGILLPYQLNTEQRLLLSNVSYLRTYSQRRTLFSTKFSSFSSLSHSPANSLQIQAMESVDSYLNDTLTILKLLSEHLHNGTEIGHNIFMYYRISINIDVSYQTVVLTKNYMRILKNALENNCMNKLDVIHDFIFGFKWSKQEVTDFFCEEIVNSTMAFTELTFDHPMMWGLNLDQDFSLVLQLLQDNCSLLGNKIYSYASAVHKSQIESAQLFKASDLVLVIELLLRAHDCFTTDCNMEGISMVLKKSKEIVTNLLVLQNWKLMVRLLTGIARYTEMNYVFQILKENDQFEYLLRKGFRKDNTLKVALLEYLQKYCPDNRDLYKIVALHFALFSEVAFLWEREAQNVIKNLITISVLEMQNNKLRVEEEPFILFQNTESTKICLNKAMENYIHATEFHLQGEKLTNATNSAKQAELIALQLALLNQVPVNGSVICLLNLRSTQITNIVSTKLRFEESLILVEAYSFHIDWSAVLYNQYVMKHDAMYFESFLKHFPLTDTLAYDISRKFITANVTSLNEVKCMKNLINKLNSLPMKYRIASELGFSDVVENLIANGQLAYLKDTVWKKGYKN